MSYDEFYFSNSKISQNLNFPPIYLLSTNENGHLSCHSLHISIFRQKLYIISLPFLHITLGICVSTEDKERAYVFLFSIPTHEPDSHTNLQNLHDKAIGEKLFNMPI